MEKKLQLLSSNYLPKDENQGYIWGKEIRVEQTTITDTGSTLVVRLKSKVEVELPIPNPGQKVILVTRHVPPKRFSITTSWSPSQKP